MMQPALLRFFRLLFRAEVHTPTIPVIGLRENLQETMVFTIKYGFPAKFPLNQSIEQWDVFRIKSQSAQSDHFWDAT